MNKRTAAMLALLFYASVLPWNAHALQNGSFDTLRANDLIARGPYVDVRAYMDGQAGRNTLAAWQADNTISVTAAVSAAYAASDFVYFPPGTYSCSIALTRSNTPIGIAGAGREKTIIKNNSSASSGISLTNCDFSIIKDFTLNNNEKANHGIYALHSTYLNIERIVFKNYGNSSVTGKFGMYLDGCTLSSISDIDYYDNLLAYGGHLYVNGSYYSTFKKFSAGKAGSASSCFSVNLNEAHGVNFHGLYLEEGGGNGLIFIQSSENVSFTGFSSELYANRDPSGEPGWIRLADSPNVSFNNVRIRQGGSTAPVIPLFYASGSTFKLSNAILKRYVDSVVSMVLLGTGCANLSFEDIYLYNAATDNAAPSATSFTFFDTGGQATRNVKLKNIYAKLGDPTHVTNGVTNLVTENTDGTITNTGAANIDRSITDGYWTPTLNANLTSSASTGVQTYERHGNLVTMIVFMTVGSVSGTEDVTMTLPYTAGAGVANNAQTAVAPCYVNGVDTGGTGVFALVSSGATTVAFYNTNDNAAATRLTNAGLTAGDDIAFVMSYIAAP